MKEPEIIVAGKDNGEDMVVRHQTSKGTEVYGMAIPNIHADAEWDLGPTWCYLILGEKTILIDTGRFGNVEVLESQLKTIGQSFSSIYAIIVSHCHEDHDGNLPDILPLMNAELWAHQVYPRMTSYYPDITDGAFRPDLPGSCRSCVMPEEFVQKNCNSYHKKRSQLSIDFLVNDEFESPIKDLSFASTPGHSPDSICIILENEVIFTGDTILPGITPHPSRTQSFEANRRILPERYQKENTTYGLMNYIKSLNKVANLSSRGFQATFTAHRLFYNGKFNLIHSTSDRANEIIQFHIDRCLDILEIISSEPKHLDEIVVKHFTPTQLAGVGSLMAQNELLAHIEIMEECGDVRQVGKDDELFQHTGSTQCLDLLRTYLP
ncbi:MAG: MBL fold metallo-hydrolase [Chloroflexi bacterium]|jgi:glyoxylase-like metal-dependent hydrolase (beta-lactamase superfamily II)|nr:MBL fold metallo-hydrolase [Chloroflexota bacterium]